MQSRFSTYVGFVALLLAAMVQVAFAHITQFQHVVIVVQENRTPDNLFAAMCSQLGGTEQCSGNPYTGGYDILTSNWLNASSQTGFTQPQSEALDYTYADTDDWSGFQHMCDLNAYLTCAMDGAYELSCNCGVSNPAYVYVDNSSGQIQPYIDLATSYGWANYMFQSNQGRTYPAHEFLFGATSALGADEDTNAVFQPVFANACPANFLNCGDNSTGGYICPRNAMDTTRTAQFCGDCISPPQNSWYNVLNLNPTGTVINGVEQGVEEYVPESAACSSHETLGDLLSQNDLSWGYYVCDGPAIGYGGCAASDTEPYYAEQQWNAPLASFNICNPVFSYKFIQGKKILDSAVCNNNPGEPWNNVHPDPAQMLSAVMTCNLPSVSWVVARVADSDGPAVNTGGGPAWVARVVNAIGTNPPCPGSGETYWNDTAIVITWANWGGWYDHESPPFVTTPTVIQSDFQDGFRVPLIFVSAYTSQGFIDNVSPLDYGSIVRFVEGNFGIPEGTLGFADARNHHDLSEFYDFNAVTGPRQFVPIPTNPKGRQSRHPIHPTRIRYPKTSRQAKQTGMDTGSVRTF